MSNFTTGLGGILELPESSYAAQLASINNDIEQVNIKTDDVNYNGLLSSFNYDEPVDSEEYTQLEQTILDALGESLFPRTRLFLTLKLAASNYFNQIINVRGQILTLEGISNSILTPSTVDVISELTELAQESTFNSRRFASLVYNRPSSVPVSQVISLLFSMMSKFNLTEDKYLRLARNVSESAQLFDSQFVIEDLTALNLRLTTSLTDLASSRRVYKSTAIVDGVMVDPEAYAEINQKDRPELDEDFTVDFESLISDLKTVQVTIQKAMLIKQYPNTLLLDIDSTVIISDTILIEKQVLDEVERMTTPLEVADTSAIRASLSNVSSLSTTGSVTGLRQVTDTISQLQIPDVDKTNTLSAVAQNIKPVHMANPVSAGLQESMNSANESSLSREIQIREYQSDLRTLANELNTTSMSLNSRIFENLANTEFATELLNSASEVNAIYNSALSKAGEFNQLACNVYGMFSLIVQDAEKLIQQGRDAIAKADEKLSEFLSGVREFSIANILSELDNISITELLGKLEDKVSSALDMASEEVAEAFRQAYMQTVSELSGALSSATDLINSIDSTITSFVTESTSIFSNRDWCAGCTPLPIDSSLKLELPNIQVDFLLPELPELSGEFRCGG